MPEEEKNVVEEVWGDAELGAVLREAAAKWAANEGYKRALETFVLDHCVDFAEHVGCSFESCEHSLAYNLLHEEYLCLFEKQIEKYVKKEGYSAVDFFAECRASIDDYGCALFEEVSMSTKR